MLRNFARVLTILLSLFVCALPSRAQIDKSSAQSRTLRWSSPFVKQTSEESVYRSLQFDGCHLNESKLPEYVERVELPAGFNSFEATIQVLETAPVQDPSLIPAEALVGSDFEVISQTGFRKKLPMATVRIVPIRKRGGSYEQLVRFQLQVNPTVSPLRTATRQFTSNSVLSSGSWYRIGITQQGVYKMSYQFLKDLGIDVDNMDPRRLRLYGNGGGQLPFNNSTFRRDDLQENAILVEGESDGVFDNTDYVLFFGTSQVRWKYDGNGETFTHQLNAYADTTYYFINTDLGNGKRIQSLSESGLAASQTVTTYNDFQFVESELVNLLKSGREWYGEDLDNLNSSRSYNFSFPNLIASEPVTFRANMIARAVNGSSTTNRVTASLSGQSPLVTNFNNVGSSPQDNYALPVSFNRTFLPASGNITATISFSSSDPNALGWVNFLELNARCALTATGRSTQMGFRDARSVGPGNVSEFRIASVTGAHRVWDITDPLNVGSQSFRLVSGEIRFTTSTASLKEFHLFDGVNFLTPVKAGAILNQNLHALPQADMIIVAPSQFLSAAAKLADYHRLRDGLVVHVVTPEQIFNEFSSGAQDVCAIRDFMKMFYDRANSPAEMPRYLLLYGDASYDMKYRISNNSNLITSFQSAGSLNQTQTYMSDDFFGLLDDTEGDWTSGEIVDMAVGRLPVRNSTEAEAMLNKILRYGGGDDPSLALGDWRNNITFVADDQDSNTHFKQSDTLAARANRNDGVYNIDKIYLDAYNQVSTPGGQRYPDVQQAIVDRVQRGTLLLTYIGHGGEVGWAHERILEVSDINNWTNTNKLAAFLTATCEFTRVDDPSRTSAGELVMLNPNGGGICLYTTSRLAFSSSNNNLCQRFFTHVFTPINGRMPTMGEVFEQTKIDVYTDPYVRNFLLIGDPALRLAYPQHEIVTSTINGTPIGQFADTLKALSRVTVTGEVRGSNGSRLSSFNGVLYPTVYDKSETIYTLGNDQNVSNDPSFPAPFQLRKNVIFRGKVSVTNGEFSFSFVVPKDIRFQVGNGRISYYAQNGQTDAHGYNNEVLVGGFNAQAATDSKGPEIRLYMNDDKFVRGGMTDASPFLYAVVNDTSGINTIGNGIGHDMTAELSTETNKVFVLNDYFESDLNSYQNGQVRYPFKDLRSGPHTVTFKVWDVYNNSSEATTDFVVAESADLALNHVFNYPNPFTTKTTFMFEHNRPFTNLDVQVQVFTVSGKLVKTLSGKIYSTGYRSDDLQWDGLDDFGDRIGRGVYVYKLRVRASDGSYADKFEKLVILR